MLRRHLEKYPEFPSLAAVLHVGKLYGECITVEKYLEGEFQKYINNTGDVFGGSELTMKAEAFSHFTYQKSGQQLMVVDIQGVSHQLFDPEIATSTLMDNNIIIIIITLFKCQCI